MAQRTWGSLMTRDAFAVLLNKRNVVEDLDLSSFIPPETFPADAQLILAIVYYHCKGLDMDPAYHTASAIACAAADYLMPDCDGLKSLSDCKYKLDVLEDLINGNEQKFYDAMAQYTTASFQDFTAWRGEVEPNERFAFPCAVPEGNEAEARRQFGFFCCMVRFLIHENPSNHTKGLILATVAASIICFCKKRVDENSDFSTKLKQSLLDEFRVNISNLWARSCNVLIAEIVPKYVARNALDEVYVKLNDILPEMATKFRTCVANSGGLGMSCALIIKEAVNRNPRFNWSVVQQVFANEVLAARQAIAAVTANPYIGLSDRNAYPASGYRSLAYIAKRLLMDVNGVSTLGPMQGIPNRIAFKIQMDQLIADYAARYAQLVMGEVADPIVNEQNEDARALLEACAARQPANQGV